MAVTTLDTTAAPTEARSLGYHASLDGLRGLALLAIIVYHSGLDIAPGAFLSVSTFFTLSGFLITALLLIEHRREGSVSLRGFWERRLRRLMPAALAAISLIAVAALVLADATQWIRLRADALSSVFYVANWRFIVVGDSYGAAFESPSPYTHFWTLAIEEQFYLVLPVLVIGALALGRGNRRTVAAIIGGGVVASIAWSNWLVSSGASIDRLYFGTDVRAAELLAGSLLAVWWMRRSQPLGPRGSRWARTLGPLALVAMLGLWMTADLNDTVFYRGGLALYSLLTLTVIAAALQPDGITRRLLSWRPLVWIGVLSYAAYLLHYPILIWLGQHTDMGAATRLAIALPLTFGLAVLSAHHLERPIRSGERIPRRRTGAAVLAGLAATVVIVVAVTGLFTPVDATDLSQARDWQRFLDETAAQEKSTAPRIAPYGDSTAIMTGRGLAAVSLRQPEDFVAGGGWADLGCGLISGGERRIRGETVPFEQNCANWMAEWARTSGEGPADIAVVQLGPWEVVDQQLDSGGEFLTIGEDPELDVAIEDSLRRGVDTLLEDNVMVVLLSPPDVEYGRVDGRAPDEQFAESDPARMERFREMLRDVAAANDRVEMVDLASWVAARPDDDELRPDGVHFTNDAAEEVALWLGPTLVDVYAAQTGRTDSEVIGRE